MNLHDSLSSSGFILNEQIARQVFEILPEQGPILLIMDKDSKLMFPTDYRQVKFVLQREKGVLTVLQIGAF